MKKTLVIALKIGLGFITLLIMLGNSCITSANIVVMIDDLPDLVGQTDTKFTHRLADLNSPDVADWKDHRDQLNSVDDIGFACKITNHERSVATGQIWISENKYSSPGEVTANAVKILDGIVIPAAEDTITGVTRSIDWKESADFLSNFNGAKTIIYTEKFYLYFMVKETPFYIDVKDIILFLSCNGRP
jgi:hypothetical protein